MSEGEDRRVRLPHIAALDGLRGVAVMAVLLFHGGVSWAEGGFLGVDAFFVLSGFLIATLALLEVRRSGDVGLRSFWSRRARRLLPALLVLLAGVAAYAAVVAPVDTVRAIRGDALATLGYVANWRFFLTGHGYFAQSGLPSPLLHTWSLAIEEQFYVVFPLVIVLVVRRARHPETAVAIGASVLAAASAVEMALLSHDVDRVYYGTDTRAQSLLVGVALAGVYVGGVSRRRHIRARSGVAWIGPLAFAAALTLGWRLTGSSPALYHGGLFVFSIAIGIVVIDAARHPVAPLARLLSWTPLTAIGTISYGVYVYHWPLFLVLDHERTGLTGGPLLLVRVATTLLVAAGSYIALERPVQRGALRLPRAPAVVPAAAVAAIAAVLFAVTFAIAPGSTVPADIEAGGAGSSVLVAAAAPERGPTTRVVPSDRPVRVMVVGDSVGLTLSQGMSPVASRYGVDLVDRSELGCGIARGTPFRYFGAEQPEPIGCDMWPRDWAADVQHDDPDVVLVVVGRWEVMDRMHDGRWMRVGDPPYDDYLRRELRTAISVLSERGAVVAFATAPYYKRGERANGSLYPEDDTWRVDRWNALLREVTGPRSTAALVDLGGILSPGGKFTYTVRGVRVRQGDGVHITPQGGRWLAPQLLPALTRLVRLPQPAPAAAAIPQPSSNPPG